jgi:corrinoid protein of di/trimethylamine methyltransferase
MESDQLLNQIRDSLADMQDDQVLPLVEQALANGIAPIAIIERGLRAGMDIVGTRFEAGEEFLPGLLLSARIMQDAVRVLQPHLEAGQASSPPAGRVVIGTVAGDLHDIGKNLVMIMLQLANFEVHDLGVNVPSARFLEAVQTLRPQVLAMSSLISTAVGSQKAVIDDLVRAELRGRVKVIVGGAAVTPEWAQRIGADGYSDNAVDAVKVVRQLVTST